MSEKAVPNDPSPAEEEADAVLFAYAQASQAAPDDRTLLREWAARYPAHADALVEVSYAGFAVGLSLADPLEDGPEDAETVALGRAVVDSYFAPKEPLVSLVIEAKARGLTPREFAQNLHLDTPALARLNQRLLDAAALPRSLVRQAAQALGRSADEVAAYLRLPPRLASDAQYKSKQAPVVRESGPQQRFEDVLRTLPQADRDYWRAEIEGEGVLGDE